MRWRKLGRIFGAAGQNPWFHGPAIVAIPRPMGGAAWRVFVSPRDGANRSSLCWFDMDLRRPGAVLAVSAAPVLAPGGPGAFDAAGAMGACILEAEGEERLYYQGWSLPPHRPFHTAIGLAVRRLGDHGRPFERVSDRPILVGAAGGFAGNPAVRPDGRGGWRMWFQQGLPWAQRDGGWLPRYAIAEAHSPDGRHWQARPGDGMPWARPGEVATSRFWPWREGAGWRAAFCCRGDAWPYRLGLAHSPDGRRWTRAAAPPLEPEGWEDGALCYPTVFTAEGRRWMLYNAGRYGASGLGLAVEE